MAFINKEKFVELLTDNSKSAMLRAEILNCTRSTRYVMGEHRYEHDKGDSMVHILQGHEINREAALRVFELAKQHLVTQGYFNVKQLRPWEHVNPADSLDRSQPWWGFEFETGYTSKSALSEVLEHVWDTWDNVAFDREGEGSYFSEITFTPQEMDKYLDGTADSYQFMDYLSKLGKCNDTGYSGVGTHINISLPTMDTVSKADAVCYVLNNTIRMLPQDGTRLRLFGRESIYGGCLTRTNGPQYYLEGKLFRTTYSLEQFQKYVQVCRALTAVASAACDDSIEWYNTYCTNFQEMIADSSVTPLFGSDYSLNGEDAGWYVSGNDEYEDEEEEYHDDYDYEECEEEY